MEIFGSYGDFIKIKCCLNYDISMIFCQDFCETRNVQNFLQTLFPGLDTFSPLRTTYSENRQQTGVTEQPEQIKDRVGQKCQERYWSSMMVINVRSNVYVNMTSGLLDVRIVTRLLLR